MFLTVSCIHRLKNNQKECFLPSALLVFPTLWVTDCLSRGPVCLGGPACDDLPDGDEDMEPSDLSEENSISPSSSPAD